MSAGFAEFHRYFGSECDRDALIVDLRYNRGGHVSQLLLEKVARRRVGYDLTRWGQPEPYPMESPAGAVVALTNEHAGSDGDIFSHCFKLMKIGPLLGTRTWGGVIGINPRHKLVDGTETTQPEFSFWFSDVGFARRELRHRSRRRGRQRAAGCARGTRPAARRCARRGARSRQRGDEARVRRTSRTSPQRPSAAADRRMIGRLRGRSCMSADNIMKPWSGATCSSDPEVSHQALAPKSPAHAWRVAMAFARFLLMVAFALAVPTVLPRRRRSSR